MSILIRLSSMAIFDIGIHIIENIASTETVSIIQV
jgi:hypothetical protein